MNIQTQKKNFISKSIYSNPRNLIYYLADPNLSDFHASILKKKQLSTNLGTVEIAIISASHYFKLDNYFIEIVSCLPENIDLCFEKYKSFNRLEVNKKFNQFDYSCQLTKNKFRTSKEFLAAESQIYQQENTLFHAFEGTSALTALLISQHKNNIRLKTWHTYPDFNEIVFSQTSLQSK